MSRILAAAFVCLTLISLGSARVGDEWTATRGDSTPDRRYLSATTTTSGRIIGLAESGAYAYSDDGGSSWSYDQIEANGVPLRGSFSCIYQVPGAELIAVMLELEEAEAGTFDYYVRTYFVTSLDNGNTWTKSPFPWRHATYFNGREYYGVNITGLATGPGGELLAYGTTSGTDHPGFMFWHVGGVIFRRADTGWQQVQFGFGPVFKIANAGGRLVAASHSAILDSPDGTGWNGYLMSDTQVQLDSEPVDPETRERLRVIDVEALNDTYIAQGATFVPYRKSKTIDTSKFDEIFKLRSESPFSGSRFWEASQLPTFHGFYTKLGDNIISAGAGGAYYTSSGEGGFTLAEAAMTADGDAIAVTGPASAVAVESSEAAWRTTNSGANWTKIYDNPTELNLDLIGYYNGILFAKESYQTGALWASHDNGESWEERSADFQANPTIVQLEDGTLFAPMGSNRFQVSEDAGLTWATRQIEGAGVIAGRMLKKADGGLVIPHRATFISDDNGETWERKQTNLTFDDDPTAAVVTQTGRILIASNTFSTFNPILTYSDDGGDTWTRSEVLQSTSGLDGIAGNPGSKAITIEKFVAGVSGRIVALGDDEVLTSDDNGETWTVRLNLEEDDPTTFSDYAIRDVIEIGSRWIAVGSYETPHPQNRLRQFILTSSDDGATWGRTPFETNEPSTSLRYLAEGAGGRLVISGTNASVYVSDPEPVRPPAPPALLIREGQQSDVPVERPDVEGAIEVRYSAVERTAIAGEDYQPSGGTLTWAADETEPKTVPLETIDNSTENDERHLVLQLVFETADGLLGEIETPVYIIDDDGSLAGLVFQGVEGLYTSEAGASATLGFVLEAEPSADVTVNVGGLDTTEGELSATTFTFTPANWNQPQALTITGLDDRFPDGDATYELSFAISSTDESYEILQPTRIAVTNTGDEPYQVGGEALDPLLEPFVGRPLSLGRDRTIAFAVPASATNIEFGSEVSSDLETWIEGPDPVAGATVDGLTTYTLTLPEPDPASFARITFSLAQEE